MARAKIISAVSGKSDWYLVEDDLGIQREVQSAIAGFDYAAGGDYRLFVPDGEYLPCSLRLLPYKSARRLIPVAELSESRPASAAALYFYAEKMRDTQTDDKLLTVKEVKPGVALFEEGGCAKIPDWTDGLYLAGDCVAVIHDPQPESADEICLKSGIGKPWVAGFGCGQQPRPFTCNSAIESFTGYPSPFADLTNGGGNEDASQNAPGSFTFKKPKPEKFEITGWQLSTGEPYVSDGQPYGIAAEVSIGGSLWMESETMERDVDYSEGENLKSTYPRPMLMPPSLGLYTPTTPAVISPPVIAQAAIGKNLVCGGRKLKMTVNILTRDEHNHYTDKDGLGTGLQLPACLALIFGKAAYPDYLDGSTINQNLYTTGYPDNLPKFASVMECNLDKQFSLLYAAPGSHDFSILRKEYPGSLSAGHCALYRPEPRRKSDGSFEPVGGAADMAQRKLNVPMTDPETGFSEIGLLHARCFDYYGTDITPAPGQFSSGGLFPGYFEIAAQSDVKRNLHQDFMAAYPFMANPAINPDGGLPPLTKAVFYLQGKLYQDGGGDWRANATTLECKKLEFFYE